MQEENEPIKLLVGNIVAERYFGPNKEIRKGTKHFSGGTKVYIINWYPGMCETIVVAGIRRKTKRIISLCINVKYVENLRIKTVYKKNIIEKVKEQHYQFEPEIIKELAERMLETIPHWQKNLSGSSNELKTEKFKGSVSNSRSWFGIIERLNKIVIKRKP